MWEILSVKYFKNLLYKARDVDYSNMTYIVNACGKWVSYQQANVIEKLCVLYSWT